MYTCGMCCNAVCLDQVPEDGQIKDAIEARVPDEKETRRTREQLKNGICIQCNGVYKNLLTKILSGYLFAETRTSGGYPTLVHIILLNIATKLELRKATHAAKLELLEATLVALESYKRRCTVAKWSNLKFHRN